MAERFRIVSTAQTTAIVNGAPVEVVEVSFTTLLGSPGAVQVPIDRANTQTVREAIEARVTLLESLEGMGEATVMVTEE